jgi:DNA excision repair protein ERCC-4
VISAACVRTTLPNESPYKAPFVISVDTREQQPLSFPGFAVMRKTLPTGDYSMVGFEDRIAIERKNYADAWGCVAGERKRFERCLARLAQLDRAAIVIECSLSEFQVQPSHVQRVTPATAVGSYLSWMVQYNIPVVWCDNRDFAARVVVRILASYFKHRGGLDGAVPIVGQAVSEKC